MGCRLPGFSVQGIFQARTLEWFAIFFSRGSFQAKDRIQVSFIAGRLFTIWATRETQLNLCSVQFSSSVTSDSVTPWTAARQASLSITNSWSPPKPMSIKSMIPSNYLILCRPLLLLPSIFPTTGSFQMSQFFASGGQSIGVSASASVFQLIFWTNFL